VELPGGSATTAVIFTLRSLPIFKVLLSGSVFPKKALAADSDNTTEEGSLIAVAALPLINFHVKV
jgi:hypothetical protein